MDEVKIQANFRRICMESLEQTSPHIDPSICTKSLIFAKAAFFILLFLNMLTNLITSQI